MKKALAVIGLFAIVAIIGSVLYFTQKTETRTENLMEDQDYFREKLFNDFIMKHRKNYFNEEEYNFRLNVFKQRIDEIERHNQSNAGYTKEINRFADLTDAEFKRLYLGYQKSSIEVEEFNFVEHQLFKEHIEIESSLDWKKKGAVAAVKDQGSCGSCWAFSTVAGIEGANQIKTGKMTTFSEQQLVDCAGGHYGNLGCDGGDLPGAFNYERDHGTSTERDYPYKGKDGKCKVSETLEAPQKLVKSAKSVKRYSDKALKQALSIQPLAVCIDASTLQFYSSGVIPVNDCGKRPQLDHCVLLYGYDGTKSWSLKNSWGSSWGEDGYFRFAQGGDTCGIQEEAMVVTLK